jgi:hypothetical protein
MEKYSEQVEAIKQRFDNDLQELGERIRNEVVAPACKNHRLKFFAGNGTFFFSKGKKTYADVLDPDFQSAPKAIRETLKPIIDLLNTEITHNDFLGYYVGDVR